MGNKQQIKTNREWLESLKIDPLAKELANGRCAHCVYYDRPGCCPGTCEKGVKRWLKSKHKDKETK